MRTECQLPLPLRLHARPYCEHRVNPVLLTCAINCTVAVANRAILNRTYNVLSSFGARRVPCEFKMKEKSQPVVEFVAHVLNPSQPSTSALLVRFKFHQDGVALSERKAFACRYTVDARAGGCDS